MQNIRSEIVRCCRENPREFIRREEESYRNGLEYLAGKIVRIPECRLICIAGPSASGKTTTARMLERRMNRQGIPTAVLSMDDFYLPREKQPLLKDGTPDIESVGALDLPRLKECVRQLLTTGKCVAPGFDFLLRRQTDCGAAIAIPKGGKIIVEGIHGLNPAVTQPLFSFGLFRIYVSVRTNLIEDDGTVFLTGRQIRLIRRAIRDRQFRSADFAETMRLWPGVVRQEEENLLRFRENADETVSTFHGFEPAVYSGILSGLLPEMRGSSDSWKEFLSVAEKLRQFQPISPEGIPADSLIREFIG